MYSNIIYSCYTIRVNKEIHLVDRNIGGDTHVFSFKKPPQTPSDRTETFPSGKYTDGLSASRAAFSVPDHAFRHSPAAVFRTAEIILDRYEVTPRLITQDPVRGLLILALADEWLSTEKISDKKALLDVLKVLATGYDQNGIYTTQSGVVQKLTDKELPRGTLFHPLWPDREGNYRAYTYDEYLEKFTDQRLTDEARSAASQWGEGSELHSVRTKLEITKETEKRYEIYVVGRNSLEVGNEMGWGGAGAFRVGQRIFLPSNYRDYKCEDHEYAHTQGDNLFFGHKNLLFFYFDEAITESVTSDPTTYSGQRGVLSRLYKNQPDLRTDILRAYRGDKDARFQMFEKITDRYGLAGLLAVARLGLSSTPDDNKYPVEKSIYLPPDIVMGVLYKNDLEVIGSDKVAQPC